MWKRSVRICIIEILLLCIYGCAQTVEETETLAVETENVKENEPSEDKKDESAEPFIDEELYLFIKGVYEEIDWDIQFLPGSESKRDLYGEQFIKMLKEEIPVVDGERGYETTVSHLGEIEMDSYYLDYDPNHYNYYFYDVDGDGMPELGMTDNQRFVYIFKYEEDTDRVVIWAEYIGGISIIATGKFYLSTWNYYQYMGLDENGEYIRLARFKVEGGSKYESAGDDGWAFFVALPEYMEIEKWMLAQAAYDDIYVCYFFRVTKEQFDELEGRFLEASHESYIERGMVTYTYEELLDFRGNLQAVMIHF